MKQQFLAFSVFLDLIEKSGEEMPVYMINSPVVHGMDKSPTKRFREIYQKVRNLLNRMCSSLLKVFYLMVILVPYFW